MLTEEEIKQLQDKVTTLTAKLEESENKLSELDKKDPPSSNNDDLVGSIIELREKIESISSLLENKDNNNLNTSKKGFFAWLMEG